MITTNAATSTPVASTTTNSAGNLDKNAFLKLLITELKNQDPLNPMDDKDTIAQLAQFSSLEQMQSINTNLQSSSQNSSLLNSAAMIGRTVSAMDTSTGLSFSEKVDSLWFDSGKIILHTANHEIPLENIIGLS